MSVDRVVLLNDYLVHRIVVVEGDEGEASLLATLPVCHHLRHLDLAVLLKVISQVVLLCVFLDAPHKDLLHRQVSPGAGGVLSGHGTFRFDDTTIHLVGSGSHSPVYLRHAGVGDKAEAPGSLGVGIPHHHAVGQPAPLLKVVA